MGEIRRESCGRGRVQQIRSLSKSFEYLHDCAEDEREGGVSNDRHAGGCHTHHLRRTSFLRMRTRSLRPDCVAAPLPHVNTTRLPLEEMKIYFQNLLTNEKHTKFCEYLLSRSVSFISEYHRQSTELLISKDINLWRVIARVIFPSSIPPAVQYELTNPKFDQILQRIYQFYQRIMIKTWPQRQNLDSEINESRATLLLFELDQQIILTILESDHTINQEMSRLRQEHSGGINFLKGEGGWGTHFLEVLVLKVIIFSITLWLCCCWGEDR
jgi:hypothetical protein